MGKRLGPSVFILNVISLFWIVAQINVTSSRHWGNYRNGSLTKKLTLLWVICKRPRGLRSCTFVTYGDAVEWNCQNPFDRIFIRNEIQKVQNPVVWNPFWYVVVEECSGKEQTVDKGYTVTPSAQPDTLQLFFFYYYIVQCSPVHFGYRGIWGAWNCNNVWSQLSPWYCLSDCCLN